MDLEIKQILDEAVNRYNQPNFIKDDPISIPHLFSKQQDIEIMGFWISMIAFGRRNMIIKNGKRLIDLMDGAPHDFILNHEEKDRKPFLDFKHRTFQPTDALYFLEFFQQYYRKNDSLVYAFSDFLNDDSDDIEGALIGFHKQFFDSDVAPDRTRKHVPTPKRKSGCKRINMFLRWMVRKDEKGVDFGIWSNQISPSQLLIPLDVHVDRVARSFGLLERKQTDWKAVKELTANLRLLDSEDPVKYDFALFGLGIEGSKFS